MDVHIRPLRQAPTLSTALQDDGWELETRRDGVLCARHPQAPDESRARSRLHRLGFLTSGSLRIEFCRIGTCQAGVS